METTPSIEAQPVAAAIQEATEVAEQVGAYGFLITNSLYLIIGGMVIVFLLHRLTAKFLYPYIKKTVADAGGFWNLIYPDSGCYPVDGTQ